jgi:hypothetical protein
LRESILSQQEKADKSNEEDLPGEPVVCKVQGCEAEAKTGCHGYCNDHYTRVLYSL